VLSATLDDGLRRYAIGEKLRALRLRKKMGLVELGKHTGLSAALLSKIERGKLFPTLPTLLRIALVFNVGIEHFFNDDGKRPVIAVSRHKERLQFPEGGKRVSPSYIFESLDFGANDRKLNAYYAEFQTQDAKKVQLHQHEGIEFLYVLAGRLCMQIGDEEIALDRRDSLYFDSSVAHGYWSAGEGKTAAIIVTTN
jgi:transcriptional regulator with XRE-family HTH domain